MRTQCVERVHPATNSGKRPSVMVSLGRKIIEQAFQRITRGELVVRENGEQVTYGAGEEGALRVVLDIDNPEFYADAAFGGDIGGAEAYMKGFWHCSDLTAMIRLMQQNRGVLEKIESGVATIGLTMAKLAHRLRRNTVRGSRRNIVAHYDLSPEFFQLFLDPSMMYSCAIFADETTSLEAASKAKNDRICKKLGLGPDDHLVEIGSGWGGFAIHAAESYGCRVTTTTISDRQFEVAKQRVRQANLGDRVTVLKTDYRHLEGAFDKLVSIEMIEAVGHEFYDDYFRACSNLLKPDGLMLIQAIIIDDRQYDVAKRSVDFIQRYMFPGSCLPSITAICESIRDASDMRLFHLEDITPNYARTLRLWRERFLGNLEAVRALGFSEEFIRMWEFYFCYCEGGFLERWIGDVQMVFTKPNCRKAPILGQLERPTP